MNEPQMAALLVSHKKPGFYFRVLQEGEVEEGSEIIKVADGQERMTVAEIDAMLYLGRHSREQLERALHIPALSPGWKTSFQALLEQTLTGSSVGGNPGLAPASSPPPAWPGFRPLRVSHMEQESRSVLSLVLVRQTSNPSRLPCLVSSWCYACDPRPMGHRSYATIRSPTRPVLITTV